MTRALLIRRVLLLLLFGVLCGSLASNIGLSLLARRLYGESLLAQVWPVGSPGPAIAGPEAPGSKTVLLMGDSRVVDWGLPEIRNARIVNVGTCGVTSAQLALRCEELLGKYKPEIVVLQVGINDLN